MDELIEINSKLEKLCSNYRKTSRGYKKATIEKKLEEADELKDKFDRLSRNPDLPQQKLYELTAKFKETFRLLYNKLRQDISNMPDTIVNRPALSLKDVNAIVTQFNGDPLEVIAFTETIQMVSDTTDSSHRATLAKYIYNAKLTSRVRTAIGVAPTTIEDLITRLKKRYKSKKSLASIELYTQIQ